MLVNGAVLAASILILAATGGWLWLERQWSAWEPPTGPEAKVGYEAFTHGPFRRPRQHGTKLRGGKFASGTH